MSRPPPSASFRGPPPHFTLNAQNNRQVLTRKLAAILLKPLSDHPYQTIVLSGSAFGDAAATVAGPLLLTLARKQCLHTVILSDIIASLPADEALRSLSSIASSIGTYKRLRAVDLSHNAIGTMGMAHCAPLLQGQTLLEVVNLEVTGLSADAARLLCEYLTTTTPTVLRGLNVHGNRLESNGMLHVATVVSKSPHLQCLRVSSVGASSDAVTALANALIDTPNLCEIDISDNGFDDASATALAKALANQSNMTRVILSDLNLSDVGFHEIANSLQSSFAPLTELRLSGNELGAGVSNDIAKLLTVPASQLAILDLSSNELGDDGIHRIAEAIDASSPSLLCKLSVAENEASAASIIHLASSLVRLTSLVQFDFTGNDVSLSISQRIASVFPPTVVTIDDESEEDSDIQVDPDADTEADLEDTDDFVDDDNQGVSQTDTSGSDELEIALQALESLAKTQSTSRTTEDVSSPRPHSDVARLVSFFSKSDCVEPTEEHLPSEPSTSSVQEKSENPDTVSEVPCEASVGPPPIAPGAESLSLVRDDENTCSEPKEADIMSHGTPPVSRLLGSVISPITPPSGDGGVTIDDGDSKTCNNIEDESIADVAEASDEKDGNVILSARKLKESIVSLSKEISDVAGELQMPDSPNLQTQDLRQIADSNIDAEENVNEYLLVDKEGDQTRNTPVLSMLVDCVGGCLVAMFVVVVVLAIAQSQEESTFPFRPL